MGGHKKSQEVVQQQHAPYTTPLTDLYCVHIAGPRGPEERRVRCAIALWSALPVLAVLQARVTMHVGWVSVTVYVTVGVPRPQGDDALRLRLGLGLRRLGLRLRLWLGRRWARQGSGSGSNSRSQAIRLAQGSCV